MSVQGSVRVTVAHEQRSCYSQVAQGVLTVLSTVGTLCFTLRAQPRVALSTKPVSESLEARLDPWSFSRCSLFISTLFT